MSLCYSMKQKIAINMGRRLVNTHELRMEIKMVNKNKILKNWSKTSIKKFKKKWRPNPIKIKSDHDVENDDEFGKHDFCVQLYTF